MGPVKVGRIGALNRTRARGVLAAGVALLAVLLCAAPTAAARTLHIARCRAGTGTPWRLYVSRDRTVYFVGHWYGISVYQLEPNNFGAAAPEHLCSFIRGKVKALTRVKNHSPAKIHIKGVDPHDSYSAFACHQNGSVFARTNYRAGWDQGSVECNRTIDIPNFNIQIEQSFKIFPDGAPPNCDYAVVNGNRNSGPCATPVPLDAHKGF